MNERGESSLTQPHDWAGRTLINWTRLLAAHRIVLTLILIALGILFSTLSAKIRWQADILQFFSGNSAEVRNIREASQQPGLATQLRLDVHANANDVDIIPITKELAAKLQATNEFRIVWTGVDTSDLAAAYSNLLAQGPALLDTDEQKEIETGATAAYLQKRFAAIKVKLADPDGEMLLAQARNDPLDLGDLLTQRLRQLSPANQTAIMQDGVLIARDATDKQHAMIVTEPWSLPSDQKAAEKTLQATYAVIDAVKQQHPGIGVWVVGAHRGYVENAHRVITDVTWISLLGSVAVGLAIALYFRRISTALLCIIPATIGVGIALGLAGMLHIELPLILLGFAGLLCGSTTDYGIQIISQCRRLFTKNAGVWNADIPAIAARRMIGPISMSVATSVTGFAALGLSDSPGLRALGLFVAAATICIWIVTFLVLPAYLGTWVLPKRSEPSQLKFPRWIWWISFTAFICITCWLGWAALHVRFNSDPRALDGSSAELRAEEEEFFHVWGNLRDRAIVLTRSPSANATLTLSNQIDQYCRDLVRDGQIAAVVSPVGTLPDQAMVDQRVGMWQRYWTPARRESLQSALTAAAIANGLKPAAFTGYANRVTNVSAESDVDRIQHSPAILFPGFVDVAKNGTTTLASIVQMRTDRSLRLETGWAQELRLRFPEAIILSGQMLAFDATERARAEGERLGPWCLLAILLPLWIYFRTLRRAWLAMVCLLIGFVWVLGAVQIFGGGLNLLSLVPVLFTLGVAVDYGIYAVSDPAWNKKITEDTGGTENRLSATFLCAMTTILGSGSLIIASHPAMRWLGITLVAGIGGGYLTSLFVVAPLMRWESSRMRKSAWRKTRSLVGNVALLGMTALLIVPMAAEWMLAQERPAGEQTVKRIAVQEVRPRVYEASGSWMRWRPTSKDAGIWEITLVGSPEDRGTAVSALGSPIDVRIENEMLDQLDQLVPEEWARWLLLRGVGTNLVNLPAYVPEEYQREVYASATSYDDPHAYLAPAYPRILSYHALHDVSQMLIDNPLIVPKQFACTGVISLPGYTGNANNDGGDLMLGRAFDFEGGESFGRQKSVTYVIPPTGEGIPFAHVAWPGLAGCVTGMNAEKLALFINAAATKDFRRIGTPTIFMAREVLEHAHNIEEAERIIRATPVFVSDIIVVADGKTGQARVFEKSPGATDIYDVRGSAVVTNHLITPKFSDDPVNKERKEEGTTMQRYARARQLLDRMQHRVSVESLADLLRDKRGQDDLDIGYGNRNAIDGLIACHAVIMDVTKGQMWVGGWPNCEGAFVGIDVMAMLKSAGKGSSIMADASPSTIMEDRIMSNGTWERVLASRAAEREAIDALRAGDVAKATTEAKHEVEENASFYFGHELLGRALLKSGDKAGAKVELNEALRLDPPYAMRRAEIEELLQQCDTH